MPINPNLSGTPIMGFSSPSVFYIGWTGSGTYQIRGLDWSMTDNPTFNTLDQKTQGGREVMNSMYLNPLHSFKLVFNFLENDPALNIEGNPDTDYRMLYSFYTAMNGRFGEFLYQPRDSAFTHAPLALPDTNGYVELVLADGPFFSESVQEMNSVLPTIYVYSPSGSPPGYTDVTSTCTFYTAGSVAPYSGIAFTSTTTLSGDEVFVMSGSAFWRVHFDKDNLSFEEFMYLLGKTGIGLSQVRI
jgi:hypothetical protein